MVAGRSLLALACTSLLLQKTRFFSLKCIHLFAKRVIEQGTDDSPHNIVVALIALKTLFAVVVRCLALRCEKCDGKRLSAKSAVL